MRHASFNHHSLQIAPGLSFSKTRHGAALGFTGPSKSIPTLQMQKQKKSELVGAAIGLLRGCRGLQRLGRDGICFSLYDDGLNDLLLVRVEDFSEILVELWLFVLELW